MQQTPGLEEAIISAIVFVCLFGGGMLGMFLRPRLPAHQLADDSKHVLETGLGIIGTIGGLVLGLLVASAFGTYNAQRNEVIDLSAKVVLLDRMLADYGPEAERPRKVLKTAVVKTLDTIWPEHGRSNVDPSAVGGEVVYDEIHALDSKSDIQKADKTAALGLVMDIAQTRWLMYEQLSVTISLPLLAVLVFWFTITFMGLGVFAPTNGTVITALLVAALAVSGAVYLIQSMYAPFHGAIQIPSAPLRDALLHLGR